MTGTQELLAEFTRSGSESAFRDLVTRYLNLVYWTAVRLVDGDTHRAQDVAQIVFADLARMAPRLPGDTLLGGWLHRHTCFVARTVMRGERRRRARERQAVEMNALNDQTDSVLATLAPILDEAINDLGADDRDAILLRFFERLNLRSVGDALGTTENVAQKRVSRALQELGTLLQRRGVTFSVAALASGLAAGVVEAAPAGLAPSIAETVLCSAGTAGSVGLGSTKIALMAKLKVGIVAALVVVGVVTVILLQNQSRIGAGKNRSVSQQLNQQHGENLATPGLATQAAAPPTAGRQLPNMRGLNVGALQPTTETPSVTAPQESSTTVRQKVVPRNAIGPSLRFYAKPGSKIRIEGTSNVHDWQVESSLIGGFLEVGSNFPLESGLSPQPGPVEAQVEAFIIVRSLKSIEKDGRPYSDKMDEVMYESMESEQNPKIRYRLLELSLKGTTNDNDVLQYEFESHGELMVAGVTNEITMPIYVLPLGSGKLKISGGISLKMTTFQIDPPTAMGLIKTGDEVTVTFAWVVGIRASSAQQPQPVPGS